MYVIYWRSNTYNIYYHTFCPKANADGFDKYDISYWLVPGTYEGD